VTTARTVLAATRALDAAGIPYALIGATAMSAHGVARTTRDADLLASPGALRADVWRAVRSPRAQIRLGDDDDPLAGVVRVGTERSRVPVDIVVPRGGPWLGEVIERARRVGPRFYLAGVELPVVTLEDLVLLKVDAGGLIDRVDIAMLFEAWPDRVPALVAHVDAHLGHLSPWAVDGWRRLRTELVR